MFEKIKNYHKWILLILISIPWGLIIYWIFEINENILIRIAAICALPILWTFGDWSYSRNMPNLDDPKNLGATATVLGNFEQIGDKFEGHIKLNGVKWKAKSDSFAFKAGTVVKTKSLDGLTYEVVEKKRK